MRRGGEAGDEQIDPLLDLLRGSNERSDRSCPRRLSGGIRDAPVRGVGRPGSSGQISLTLSHSVMTWSKRERANR